MSESQTSLLNKRYTFRLSCIHPDQEPKKIECLTYDTGLKQYVGLMNTGEAFRGLPTVAQKPNVHSYVISQREAWTKNDSGYTKLFQDFSYYPPELEEKLKDHERRENMLVRLFHDFCKQHENVIVKDKTGNNSNPNLNMSLYELEDIGAEEINKVAKNEKYDAVSSIITEMFKNNDKHNEFVDFCYAIGITNVETRTKQALYNIIMDKATINPDYVQSMLDNQKKWLYTLIEKGMFLPIGEGENNVAIPNEGGFYMLNGNAIGKDKEELVKYFESNSGALTLLEQKLGTYHDRVILPIIPKAAPLSVVEAESKDLKTLSEEDLKARKEVKDYVYKACYSHFKKAGGKEAFDARMKEIKDNYPLHLDYISDYTNELQGRFKTESE